MPGCVVGGVCWLVGIGWGARGGWWLSAGGPCGGTCGCCSDCWGGTCCCVNTGGDTVVTVDRLGLPPDVSDWLKGVFCIWGTANKHKQLSKWCFKYGKYSETAEDPRIQGHNLTHIGSSAAEWLHLAPSVLHHGPPLERDSLARERVCMQQRHNIHEVSSLACTALLENKARSFHQIQMHSCSSHQPLRSIQMSL